MAKHLDRKELKQPDEFVTFWARVGQKAATRRKELLGGSVALFVVIAGSMGLSAYSDSRASHTTQAFARIAKVATADLLPADGETPKSDDDAPRFKTDKERTEAALKETDAFLAAHGGGKLKLKAQLVKAGFLLDLAKYDEAIAIYDQLVGGSLDRSLRFLAIEGVGYANEGKGDLDRALDAFGKLAVEGATMGGFYRDRGLYHQARMAERKGNAKQAGDLLREVLDKTPSTSLRDEITTRLAVLDGK